MLIINYCGRQWNLFFSSKGSYNTNIKLTDKDEIIQNYEKVSETLNSFFENPVSSLKLNANLFVINNEHKNIQDPIEKIIVQFHPNILIIKNKIGNTNIFCFKHVMLSDIKNKIKGLNPNKATTHNNIPPKIPRQSAEVTANTLQLLFNDAISNSEFPENLKLADVTPVSKEKGPLDKTNYRPVSVLPPVSKIFESLMQKQIKIPIIYVNTKRLSVRSMLYCLLENVGKNPWWQRIRWSIFDVFIKSVWHLTSWTINCKTWCLWF